MAFRFRKSVKIAPGVRLNFSKSGVSTSIGRRGATVNISKRGTRVTAGIPGTGLSASHLYKATPTSAQQKNPELSPGGWTVVCWILALILGGIALRSCADNKATAPNNQRIAAAAATTSAQPAKHAYTPAMLPADAVAAPASAIPPTKTLYVGPQTLNVRSSPNGTVAGSLKHGAAVEIHAENGGWSRISADGRPERWVSSAYLCKQRDCSDIPKWKPPPVAAPASAPVRRAAPTASSYGCPCSSSSNCYGPRGGRYCITSGGNKRYR